MLNKDLLQPISKLRRSIYPIMVTPKFKRKALALHQLAPLSNLFRYDQHHAARNKKLEQVNEFFSSLFLPKALMLSCKSDGCTVQLTYAAELVRVQIQHLTAYPKLSFRAYIALQKKKKSQILTH